MSKFSKLIKKLAWFKAHPKAQDKPTTGAFGKAREFTQFVETEVDAKFLSRGARQRLGLTKQTN
jgi:hypothetical protein